MRVDTVIQAVPAALNIVHVNVDFPPVDDTVGIDHEQLVVRFGFKKKPDDDDGDDRAATIRE